jgi:hypothetical protein
MGHQQRAEHCHRHAVTYGQAAGGEPGDAERGEGRAGGTMVKSLTADPEAPQRRVIVDQMVFRMFSHCLPLLSQDRPYETAIGKRGCVIRRRYQGLSAAPT